MSKRLITAALVGLTLAGSFARADSQDQRVRRQLRDSFGLVIESSSRGGQEEVSIAEVLPGSPAERAGFQQGDVILRVGRHSIEDFRDLAYALTRLQQGDPVNLQVERNNRRQALRITPRMPGADEDDRGPRYGREAGEATNGDRNYQQLEQRFRRLESRFQEMERQGRSGRDRGDSAYQARDFQRLQQRLEQMEERVEQAQRGNRYGRNTSPSMLGVQVREWRRQDDDTPRGGSAEEGVEVMMVNPDSLAAEAGLRRGDIITRMDNREVTSKQELRQAWQRTSSGQETTLEVLRGKRQMRVYIQRENGSRYGGRDRRYERLHERIDQLESRLRELEQDR